RDHDQQFDQRETRLRATERSLALHNNLKLLPGLNVRGLQSISVALLKRLTVERVPNITTKAAARETPIPYPLHLLGFGINPRFCAYILSASARARIAWIIQA